MSNDPTIVKINRNKRSKQNDGSIYHEIVLDNGKRIYCDPENYNYSRYWMHIIQEDAIGLRLHGLKLKNWRCYNADYLGGVSWPETEPEVVDNGTTFNDILEIE